jgi:hypothetical protein
LERFVQKRILGRTGFEVMEISLSARTPEQIKQGIEVATLQPLSGGLVQGLEARYNGRTAVINTGGYKPGEICFLSPHL